MKTMNVNFFLLFSFSVSNFCISPSQAQITIFKNDVMSIGDVLVQATDTLPSLITIGPSGANQTWDFSAINEDILDTLSFVNPSLLPESSNFFNSNLGLDDPISGVGIFFEKTSLSLSFLGGGDPNLGFFVDFPITWITFPSTIGTSFTKVSTGIIQLTRIIHCVDNLGVG